MEFMIKGTSALVSDPSQCVKQVAPLPEEQGWNDSCYSWWDLSKQADLIPVHSDHLIFAYLQGKIETAAQPTHSDQGTGRYRADQRKGELSGVRFPVGHQDTQIKKLMVPNLVGVNNDFLYLSHHTCVPQDHNVTSGGIIRTQNGDGACLKKK